VESDLLRTKRDWENNAHADPLRAILAIPPGQSWDENDFFETGKREIEIVLRHARSRGLTLEMAGPALDFGCGVGRLTQALAEHFEKVHGTDISQGMIDLANTYNQHVSSCHYQVNSADLRAYPRDYFTFIYSSIVLQHIPPKATKHYIAEFMRTLKPSGVLIFQIPSDHKASVLTKLRMVARPRSRFIEGAEKIRLTQRKHNRSYMHSIPEHVVSCLVRSQGGRVVDVQLTNSESRAGTDDLLYLDHEPLSGFVSKQYIVTKPQQSMQRPVWV